MSRPKVAPHSGPIEPSPVFRTLDLFCGTGALSHGISIRSNGLFRTVAGIELDSAACQTAAANAPFAKIHCGDIRSMDPNDLLGHFSGQPIDLIVGGPPCQGFSSIRPSRGQSLQDPRNQLYKEFVRYVEALRPSVFIMENVVGLINANGGDLLSTIVQSFENIGYVVDWKVLNSAHYGVPQKRERVFLIGAKSSSFSGIKLRFPIPTHRFDGRVIGTKQKENYIVNRSSGKSAVVVWDAISDLPPLSSGGRNSTYIGPPRNEYQEARRCNNGGALTLHEAANHSKKMLEIIQHSGNSINALPNGLVSSGYSSCYSRLEGDKPSTTITVKFTSPASSKCIHPFDNRAITPREAARLQSFDDNFDFYGSKTQIASQIGNAVPPLFGAAFSPILLEMMNSRVSVGEL